jgi:hypothetical protein
MRGLYTHGAAAWFIYPAPEGMKTFLDEKGLIIHPFIRTLAVSFL